MPQRNPITFFELADCNQAVAATGLPYKVHLSDACGGQSLWIEELSEADTGRAPATGSEAAEGDARPRGARETGAEEPMQGAQADGSDVSVAEEIGAETPTANGLDALHDELRRFFAERGHEIAFDAAGLRFWQP